MYIDVTVPNKRNVCTKVDIQDSQPNAETAVLWPKNNNSSSSNITHVDIINDNNTNYPIFIAPYVCVTTEALNSCVKYRVGELHLILALQGLRNRIIDLNQVLTNSVVYAINGLCQILQQFSRDLKKEPAGMTDSIRGNFPFSFTAVISLDCGK